MADPVKAKVLIVDDDVFLSGIYATKLELEGFGVVTARDGEEGVKAALKEIPDLILLDVLMPKLDGFEALRRLKQEETTKNIPVIMLTNLGQKEDIEKGLQDGAVDYLIKAHFVPAEAVEKIKKVLKIA
jgi:DNA-binding response OmpR family regulator